MYFQGQQKVKNNLIIYSIKQKYPYKLKRLIFLKKKKLLKKTIFFFKKKKLLNFKFVLFHFYNFMKDIFVIKMNIDII
jgi:hypothetical protein